MIGLVPHSLTHHNRNMAMLNTCPLCSIGSVLLDDYSYGEYLKCAKNSG